VARLDGEVAIVTGASGGQGLAEARLFHEHGAAVVLGDVATGAGEALAAELGDRAVFHRLDVRDPDDWRRAVDDAEERFGPVTVLVNNGGILRLGGVVDVTREQFDEVMHVNAWGCILGMQAVVPTMRRAGRGSIVNVSSTGGIIGQFGAIAYSASKFALRGITKTAALELAPDIRVNSLHPGWVDTPMARNPDWSDEEHLERIRPIVPMGRAGRPDEIAHAALFLASTDSSYLTGSELVVDGGRTAGTPPRRP
jgi:3alpha(or 20beta)-hydroxysteroid dehydrogenase